jgi:branched-chain amino acid transport system permease protein
MSSQEATETDADLGERIDVEKETLQWLDPRTKPLRHKLGLVGVVLLLALPAALRPLTALDVARALFFAVFVMSWDVVSGYTGQISFGHGVFFTVGGYTSALLNLEMGMSPFMAIPVGIVLAAIVGLVIGVPALRLQGPYLSLITLIAPLLILGIFKFKPDLFGGSQGLSRPDTLLGLTSGDAIVVYYLAVGLFLLVLGILLAVTRSDAGRIFTAIRESEDAVSSAGLNPAKYKVFAFVLSAAVGGLAGAVFVHTPIGSASPGTLLNLTLNIEIVIAAVIGGMGTIVGAAVGGLVFFLLQGLLGNIEFLSKIDIALFGALTLAIIYLLPGGLMRGAVQAGRAVLDRTDSDVATDGGQPDPEATPVRTVIRNWRRQLGGDDE